MHGRETRQLRRLAALYRVQTSYIDMHGQRCYASEESLLGVLRALHVPVAGMTGVDQALRMRREELLSQWLPSILLAWDGDPDGVCIRIPTRSIPSHAIGPRLQYTLHLENGDIWSGNVLTDQMRTLRYVNCGGEMAAIKALLPAKPIPLGYHKLTVLLGARAFHATVISSPMGSYQIPSSEQHEWGVFAPIYSLQSSRNWGVGDLTDAEALVAWAGGQGASLFGTLPFLATYLDVPCDPSPYTPVSRLFWNELFIDVTRLPELNDCMAAQELVGSPRFQEELRALRAGRLVDYRRAMKIKRDAMYLLSKHLVAKRGGRFDYLSARVDQDGELRNYARFRAAVQKTGKVWTVWPSGFGDTEIADESIDYVDVMYHQYVQFVASEQVEGLTRRCDAEEVSLYLDFPLGTHPQGYDTWKYRSLFALEATVGAPPDPVFTTGQNWGFHPLNPEAQQADGYRYFAATLRHQMRHAGLLRLDHVMGLHRMYWIPDGQSKSDGIYVHSPSRELYAVLTLESHRMKTALVGEDLGIVPGYVRSAMARHGLTGMSVAYWDLTADPHGALQRLAEQPNTVASLNTHDMFPFAAFWHGLDADRREELGMITASQADLERWTRGELRNRLTAHLRGMGFSIEGEGDAAGALEGILALLAGSRARWVLVNLEDLWLETSPQNIPDTVDEHPNWRQKMKLGIEEILHDEALHELLSRLSVLRGSQ